MRHLLPVLFFIASLSLFPHTFAHAESPQLILEQDGQVTAVLSPTIPSVSSLAFGDLGRDGMSEILVGTGYGTPTEIIVLRQDGSTIGSFAPYDPAFSGGASVAVCDLNQDGVNEIVTGAGFSGGPHVRVFTNMGIPTGVHFFAYEEDFRGGVSLLCRDITGDALPEIITAPGLTGGPHLKAFSPSGVLVAELMIPELSPHAGLSLFMLPDDTQTSLSVTSAAYTPHPLVAHVSYKEDRLVLDALEPSTVSSAGMIDLSTSNGHDIDQSINTVRAEEVRDGSISRLTATPTTALASDLSSQYIRVDISTQTLVAYEYGIPVFSFLISSGVPAYPTPLGKTEVLAKLPSHDYSWFYGTGNPANYSLPNVLWNLRFKKHYYIHSAHWHNNFGTPMSHGCVNASIPDAEKIYTWADVGTPVEIVQ